MSQQEYDDRTAPIKNPFMVIRDCRRNIFSSTIIIIFLSASIVVLAISVLSVYFPEYFIISNIDAISNFALNGISVVFAIFSMWTYTSNDLSLLYENGSQPRDNKIVPHDCNMEIREHFVYYSFIAEYYSATFLWIGLWFGYEIKSLISLGDDVISDIFRAVFGAIYICLLNLFLLIVAELSIKNIHRLTNKSKMETVKRRRNINENKDA